MDIKLIIELEKALRSDYNQKRHALDLDLQTKLDALSIVSGAKTKVSNEKPDSGHFTNGHKKAEILELDSRTPPPSITKAVEQALGLMEGEFTVRDLLPLVSKMLPNVELATKDLSNPLWILRKAGKIDLVTKAFGREPGRYKLKTTGP